MPERVDFWGIPGPWGPTLVYAILGLSALFMVARLAWDASLWWRIGRKEARWDHFWVRLGRVLKYYLGQIKVIKQPYPGWMHVAIFSSMVIFFIGTALATINGHFFVFLTDDIYLAYKLILDLFILVFLVGFGMAAYRRFITRPDRLTLEPRFAWTLILLFVIVFLGPFIESFRLASEKPAWAIWSPIGWGIAQLWIVMGLSNDALYNLHLAVYIVHFMTVVALFILVPTGSLLHIVTSALNIFFSKLDRPTGKLAPIATNPQGEYIYTKELRNLTWKQLLDSVTCTECGRCQDACPAYAAGRALSPKQYIQSLRKAYQTEAHRVVKGQVETKALVGEYISEEEIWSCTTCGACVAECPVMIEHVDTIVDMRRYLLSEGRIESRLQDTLVSLERYGNSFSQSERGRAKWTQPVQPKIKDCRREEAEYLWYVGDYASFNAYCVETTRQLVEIWRKAGLDFGILYEGERNAGNDVRRIGEEGLFEVLVEKNSAALQKAKFSNIVTTDPHTYNTLKNEYPKEALNGHPVLHYSELLDQLISSGKLKLTKKLDYKVTYHDPCYLGRYNQIYEAPRRVIEATGCILVEMPRSREKSFCCNAGGGQIWMEETNIHERPSENRIREAIALEGVSQFIMTCPKDLAMFKDAVKTTSNEERIAVKDLIELVYEAL